MSQSMVHGIASSTQRNFRTFCQYYGLDMFPADVLQERRYITYLSEYHKNIDSSKNYVGGVRSLHEMFGFPPPLAEYYMYKLMVNGLHREKGHMVRQAFPVSPDILAAISGMVDVDNAVQMAAWLAILCGFYLMFWCWTHAQDLTPSVS